MNDFAIAHLQKVTQCEASPGLFEDENANGNQVTLFRLRGKSELCQEASLHCKRRNKRTYGIVQDLPALGLFSSRFQEFAIHWGVIKSLMTGFSLFLSIYCVQKFGS